VLNIRGLRGIVQYPKYLRCLRNFRMLLRKPVQYARASKLASKHLNAIACESHANLDATTPLNLLVQYRASGALLKWLFASYIIAIIAIGQLGGPSGSCHQGNWAWQVVLQ